jgi:cytochrome P450
MDFNPFRPDVIADPYPHYEEMRRAGPITWNDQFAAWLVTGFDDCSAVLKDPERFSSERERRTTPNQMRQMQAGGRAATVLNSDPPKHTQLRNLVNKAFTPRSIAALEPRVRAIVDQALDEAIVDGQMDVVDGLAYPLPVTVIAEMLGVPPEDRALFKRWSDDAVTPVTPDTPEEEAQRRWRSVMDLREYFKDVIARRRRQPGDDLVSRLVTARDEGNALSEEELLAFVVLLLLAGNETTTNLISNGVLALTRNPDQQARLRAEPGLMPSAVEEFLRYDGPVQGTSRVVLEPLSLRGVDLKPGDTVMPMLAAANRDPTHFADADRLLLDRDENDHLAFGWGIHFCLGSNVARLEASIAFEKLLQRMPSIELAQPEGSLHYRPAFILRGLEHLRIAGG